MMTCKDQFATYHNVLNERFDFRSAKQKLRIPKGTSWQFRDRFQNNVLPAAHNAAESDDKECPPAQRKYICAIPLDTKHLDHFVLHESTLWYIEDVNEGSSDIIGIDLTSKRKSFKRLKGHENPVCCIAYSKERDTGILCSSDIHGNLIVWDLNTVSVLKKLKFNKGK